MVVEKNESGQSTIEFIFMLPILVGLLVIMVRSNMAVQASIVNQQYAREHVLFLAFNSPVYPEEHGNRRYRSAMQQNQMILGVSENHADEYDEGKYFPEAQTQLVTRLKSKAISAQDSPQDEPDRRNYVRVRTTVSLCTQSNIIDGDTTLQAASDADPPKALADARGFKYCWAPDVEGVGP